MASCVCVCTLFVYSIKWFSKMSNVACEMYPNPLRVHHSPFATRVDHCTTISFKTNDIISIKWQQYIPKWSQKIKVEFQVLFHLHLSFCNSFAAGNKHQNSLSHIKSSRSYGVLRKTTFGFILITLLSMIY